MGVDTSTFTDICRVCAVVGVTFLRIITLHNEACWKGNRAGNILNKIHHVTSTYCHVRLDTHCSRADGLIRSDLIIALVCEISSTSTLCFVVFYAPPPSTPLPFILSLLITPISLF